jgi:uncharacterized protein YprB with RNaseH-like and TPR domain
VVIAFDIETTGLDPYASKVILIGVKDHGTFKMWRLWEERDEAMMILSAIDFISSSEGTVVGFNNLKFDVPFMLERLRILGRWQPRLWSVFYKKWFDLYQYLGNDFRSLKYWLEKAGIESDRDIRGHQIPGLYERKEFAPIEAHNVDDLNTSEQLFLFLKQNNPELLPFD